MCGIAGLWTHNLEAEFGLELRRMAGAIEHRGPDDEGIWIDNQTGLGLAHRRLAIVDLSAAGHQPMVSAHRQYILAFNGEIYNHGALRRDLEAQGGCGGWRGHSDTETLLAGFEHWGVRNTLDKCVGMFAVALWHLPTQTLTLVRDRMGEKPLYFGWASDGAFLFASELKAFQAYQGFRGSVSRPALAQYLRFCAVPAPRTIYEGVYKLEPGCLLTIRGQPPSFPPANPLRPGESLGNLAVHRWWSLTETVGDAANRPLAGDEECIRSLEHQLQEAVEQQSLADVPLGAFLSGGVDSSTIVALMQARSERRIKTFTIGFDEAGYDESPHALAVARHLGTDHHEMRITAKDARDVIPMLPRMYDEPFADSSQIPTHLVCRAARQHVTVALSGDAGDELFGGYNRHFLGPRLWRRVGAWGHGGRHALSRALGALPKAAVDGLSRPLGLVRAGEKLDKLSEALHDTNSIDDVYRNLVSAWQDPAAVVLDGAGRAIAEPAGSLSEPLPVAGVDSAALRMMYRDSTGYLPDDILCKVDRAAMAIGLETRVPFLDHRMVELAWQLPLNVKVRGNVGKWALRQILYKYVPRELIERPKAGFAIPIGQWLRGPLRPWAESLLDEGRLRSEGYFNPKPVCAAWIDHLSGRRDRTSRLWAILMFQSWLAAQRDLALTEARAAA